MIRKLLVSMIVMVAAIGFVSAEEFVASIKKVDGDKITFTKFKKGEKAEDTTLPAAKDIKVSKGKFNKEDKKIEAGEALEGGLKNEMFTKIPEKKEAPKDKKGGFGLGGLFAQITTSADGKTITAITVMPAFAKKKDEKKTEEKKTDSK